MFPIVPAVEGGQWLVSTACGTHPLWARSGKELFYLEPDGLLMVVPVEPRSTVWHPVSRTQLLKGRYVVSVATSTSRNHDVSPEGQRFLMIKACGSASTAAPLQIVVVQHFAEELKRLVPTN